MDVFFPYKTLVFSKKIFFNLYLKKKSDSDINLETKKRKRKLNSPIYFRNIKSSKNLLLLNIDWNHVNSADIYTILNQFAPKNGKIISVSVITYHINFKNKIQTYSEADIQFFLKSNLSKDRIFGLVECDNTKTSKAIFRSCNRIELIRPNFLIDIKFVFKLNKSFLKILDYTQKKPKNYFPRFIITKSKFPNFNFSKFLNKFNKIHLKKKKYPNRNEKFFSHLKEKKKKLYVNDFTGILNKQLGYLNNKIDKNNFFSIKDMENSTAFYIKLKNTDI
jgi:hypothetical protein